MPEGRWGHVLADKISGGGNPKKQQEWKVRGLTNRLGTQKKSTDLTPDNSNALEVFETNLG